MRHRCAEARGDLRDAVHQRRDTNPSVAGDGTGVGSPEAHARCGRGDEQPRFLGSTFRSAQTCWPADILSTLPAARPRRQPFWLRMRRFPSRRSQQRLSTRPHFQSTGVNSQRSIISSSSTGGAERERTEACGHLSGALSSSAAACSVGRRLAALLLLLAPAVSLEALYDVTTGVTRETTRQGGGAGGRGGGPRTDACPHLTTSRGLYLFLMSQKYAIFLLHLSRQRVA